jgi:hypothetical protein
MADTIRLTKQDFELLTTTNAASREALDDKMNVYPTLENQCTSLEKLIRTFKSTLKPFEVGLFVIFTYWKAMFTTAAVLDLPLVTYTLLVNNNRDQQKALSDIGFDNEEHGIDFKGITALLKDNASTLRLMHVN